jgi:hypothetical protein
MGIDRQGCDQLEGKLKNTNKWIGATEIIAFLISRGIQAELLDFHVPTASDGSHPRLFQWVLGYFKSRHGKSALRTFSDTNKNFNFFSLDSNQFTPPLFFQHQVPYLLRGFYMFTWKIIFFLRATVVQLWVLRLLLETRILLLDY